MGYVMDIVLKITIWRQKWCTQSKNQWHFCTNVGLIKHINFSANLALLVFNSLMCSNLMHSWLCRNNMYILHIHAKLLNKLTRCVFIYAVHICSHSPLPWTWSLFMYILICKRIVIILKERRRLLLLLMYA